MPPIPELPTDPRAAAMQMARERLIDLKIGIAVASGIAMVALTGAVAYSTSVAVAAPAADGTVAPSGGDNTVAPAPATTEPGSRGTSPSGYGATSPPRASPRIVTAQS